MKARIASLTAAVALSTLTVVAPAHAEPVCDPFAATDPCADFLGLFDISPSLNPSADLVLGAFFELKRLDGTPASVPVQVTAAVTSCGSPIQSTSTTLGPGHAASFVFVEFSADNDITQGNMFSENPINRMVGPSFEYAITVTVPGYDPYLLDGSYDGYSVRRPSCAVINSAGYAETGEPDALIVEKWSVMKGDALARVGKSLKVTPTRAPGATIKYQWKVGSKVVDRDRILGTIRKSYLGKPVTLRVEVSKAGSKSQAMTLRFGRVR